MMKKNQHFRHSTTAIFYASRYEFEGLLYSHDTITREIADQSPTMTPNSVTNHSPPPLLDDDQDSDIKVIKIKIEKTNEPLVSLSNTY